MDQTKNSSNKTQPVLIVLLLIAAFAVGMLYQQNKNLKEEKVAGEKTTAADTATAPDPYLPPEPKIEDVAPVDTNDYVRGDANAPITWIEYSDLECPFCKKIHPDLVKLMDEYKGKVRWVYRHFPLDQIHSKARKEAVAAECVGSLGGNDAFWKFIDTVYTETPGNNGLDHSLLPGFASQAGVNQVAFKTCLDADKFAQNVEDDYQSGIKAGVSGTPGNIVMNEKGEIKLIPGALPYESLKATVEELL